MGKIKKFTLTFFMVFLLTGCTTISKQYTEPKVRPERHVGYYDYHSFCIAHPIFGGFYFYWCPSYYGYYNYFRYQDYPYQLRYRQDKRGSTSVITKKQLKAMTSTASKTVVKKATVRKSIPTTKTKNTAQEKSGVKKKK